jgi:hypothetical protein
LMSVFANLPGGEPRVLTIQFVAVIGIFENNHPDCPCRSEVRRMYLRAKVSDLPSSVDCGALTGLLLLSCPRQSQNIDFAYQSLSMAVSSSVSAALLNDPLGNRSNGLTGE